MRKEIFRQRQTLGRVLVAFIALLAIGKINASSEPRFVDFDGQPTAIDSFLSADRWLVVMIWSHTCVICAREMASQSQMHERNQSKSISVLGISLDGREGLFEAWAFVEEREVRFPNLVGEPHAVAEFFKEQTGRQLQGTPTFMIYSPGGILTAVQVGPVPPAAIEAFVARQNKQG